jgi:hypothetical protein
VETTFAAPLLVWIRPVRGQPLVKRVCDVDSGISALTRDGLGNFEIELPEWHVALNALLQAKVDPCPETIEAARTAFKAVALRTGSLLDG